MQLRLNDLEQPVLIGITTAALIVAAAETLAMAPATQAALAWGVFAAGAIGLSLRRRAAVPIAAAAFLAAAVSGNLANTEPVRMAAMSTMIVSASVMAAFTEHKPMLIVAATTACAVLAPLWWTGPGAFASALVAGLSTALVTGLVVFVTLASRRDRGAYEALFEHSPIMIIEQEWSRVLQWLDELRRSGVVDIAAYLRAHREALPWSWGLVDHVVKNPAAQVIDPSPDVGDPNMLSEASLNGHLETLTDFFHGRYYRTVTFPITDDQGKVHWHHVTSFPIDLENPGRMIVAVADVTVLREAQEELEELVRSKDRFIAAISHELRTPLAAVLGFASELRERPDVLREGERRELLDVILDQAQEAANIIEDLLVAARADMDGVSAMHTSVDLEKEMRQVLAAYPCTIEAEGMTELPDVCADAARVRQIVRNLLANALRYGGPNIRIVCSSDGRHVAIEVRDDGQELPVQKIESLFEPYIRAHERTGITESIGIGLTVSRHLASLMGGTLTAFRDDGETVFRLALPVLSRCPMVTAGDSELSSSGP